MKPLTKWVIASLVFWVICFGSVIFFCCSGASLLVFKGNKTDSSKPKTAIQTKETTEY